ncbi:MAG: hypothetical protein ACI8W3_000689 [Myxococcota bacterium]|jgi:hypothetical protein
MNRRWVAVSCGMAFVAGIWFALGRYESAQSTNAITATSPGSDSRRQALEFEREPHFNFPDTGRITIEHSALPEGDEVILALPLAADSIGDVPLPARVVGVDGRVVDVVANKASGTRPGVTVSLDPTWLTKGSYMIQLETQQDAALALRRYVLIVN